MLIWHHVWPIQEPRGHRGCSVSVELTRRGQRSYDAPGWVPSTMFFSTSGHRGVSISTRQRAMLVSEWGAMHTILASMEVVRVAILKIWAVSLFYKQRVKSTTLALRTHICHRVWLVQVLRGHHGRSTLIEPARRGPHSYITPFRGLPPTFLGQWPTWHFLLNGDIGPRWCRCRGLRTRFRPSWR